MVPYLVKEYFMADQCITVDNIMADAIKRRDELNVFIKLLTNRIQGRDLVEDRQSQEKDHLKRQQHSV
jgi:hypothetical protein